MSRIFVDLHIPIFFILYFIIVLVYSLINIKRLKTISKKLILIKYSFIFYILTLIKLTLLPITIQLKKVKLYPIETYYNIIPFKTMAQVITNNTWVVQLIGNIALLYPLPILMGILCKNKKYIIVKSILVSCFIEIVQFLINVVTKYPNKLFDIDDIILNSIGIILGYLTLVFITKYNADNLS